MPQFDPRRPYERAQGFDPAKPFEKEGAGFDMSRPFSRGPVTASEFGDGSMVRPRQRSLGERFTSVVGDAARRNPVPALARFFAGDEPQRFTDPQTGQAIEYPGLGQQMRRDERERRSLYDMESQADGWRQARGGPAGKAVAGVTNVAGAITGAAADPSSIIGGVGSTLLRRIAANAAVNAAGDAVTQSADMGSGLQNRYSVSQTALAAAIGGGLQGGMELAPRGVSAAANAVRPVVDRARTAMAPRAPLDGRAVDRAFDPAQPFTPEPPARRAGLRLESAAPEPIRRVIDDASRSFGVPADYLTQLARRESSFNPAARAETSSATGLFQFTDGTWLNTLRRHGAALGMPDAAARIEANPAAVLAMRNDPTLNTRAAAMLTRDNARALQNVLGRQPTQGELYSAHFLGEGGARRLAAADPNTPAASLLPEAARSNRSIFYEGRGRNARPRTVAELRQNFDASFSGAGPVRAAPGVDAPPVRSAPIPTGGNQRVAARLAEPLSPGPDYMALARREAPAPQFDTPSTVARDGLFAGRPAPRPIAAPEPFERMGPALAMGEPLRVSRPVRAPAREAEGLSAALRARETPMLSRPMEPVPSMAARDFTPNRSITRAGRPAPVDNIAPVRLTRLPPQENYRSPGLEAFRVDLGDSGRRVRGALEGDVRPDGTWRVRSAELSGPQRGQGQAVAAYVRAADEARANGSRLTSDSEVTPAAARVWEGLERRGYRIERNPSATLTSRAGVPDTMGMGPVSLRTPDDSPVFTVVDGPRNNGANTGSASARFDPAQPFTKLAPPELASPYRNQWGDVLNTPSTAPLASSPGRTFDPPRPLGRAEDVLPLQRPEIGLAGQSQALRFDPSQPFERAGDRFLTADNGPRQAFDPAQPFDREPAGVLGMGGRSDNLGGNQTLAIDLSAYGDRIGTGGSPIPSSGQTVGGLRAAPRPGAVPRGEGVAYAGQTVSGLARDLRNALGITARQGRISLRGASGQYDTGNAVIRTKAVQEVDVLSHEAIHALEYRRGPALTAALKQYAADLKPLAYPGAAKDALRQEGFAEFGRLYVTNPTQARADAPAFYEAFERAVAQDAPEVASKLKGIQEAYQNLLRSDSIEVAKGSLAYTGRKGPVRDLAREFKERGPGSTIGRLADRFYTSFIDDQHPLHIAVRNLSRIYNANHGRALSLKRADDPYALSRLAKEAYAAGHNDIVYGVTPYRGLDPEGISLSDALETAGLSTTATGKLKNDALREFDVYLISRRMIHEWDRFSRGELPRPPDRNTRAFHEQVIADAESSHPSWSQAAGQVYEWLGNLWRKERDAGLISEASYQNGLTAHPDYVPLMRDVSDKGPGGGGKPRGALQFAGGVKAFEGSTRDIISPLSTMMRRSYELNAIVKKNDVLKALDDLAEKAGPGAGAIVERLPPQQVEAWTADAASVLTKTADDLGLTGRDLSTIQKIADDAGDESITLFKPTAFSPKKGEKVVFVWRDGKKQPLLLPDGQLGEDMFNALAGMSRDQRSLFVDIAAAPTQALRYGVTLSPEFMAANLIRDQIATWINTDVNFRPVLDTIRGGAAELSQNQLARRYANVGGMRGGANVAATARPFPTNDAQATAQLQNLRHKGLRVRRFASWRGLAEATDLSETSTRMGVFAKGFDKAKAKGLSDYEALIEAGFTSRDYLDFGRRGSKMVAAARLVTFLNAAIQGLDKTTRVLSAGGNLQRVLAPLFGGTNTPAQRAALGHAMKAWTKIAALGAFGLGLRMLYADDPEYQEIGDPLRATHWVFKMNGQWNFVPKPFELATISNILERGYEGIALRDPTAGERLLSDFKHSLVPPYELPAIAIPMQIAQNRDRLGRPIIPDYLKGTVDPRYQFNSYTSALGKTIGRVLNISPAVVDHVITGFTGSLGRYALQGSDMVNEAITGAPRMAAGPEDTFLARRFVRDINRGSTTQAEFWDQVSRDGGDLTRSLGTFRQLAGQAKDTEALAYFNKLPAQERAFVKASYFTQDGSQKLHPMVRATESLSVISDIRRTARDGSLMDNSGTPIAMTPEQRRDVDNALAEMANVEMRNALVATGVKGWAQRDMMDRQAALARLNRASPGVGAALNQSLMLAKVPDEAAVLSVWPRIRPQWEAPIPEAQGTTLLRMRRLQGDMAGRVLEMQRLRGGRGG